MRATISIFSLIRFGSALALLSSALLVTAQEPNSLQATLARCYAITDISTRVACYDELARSQLPASAAPSVAPTAAPVATRVAPTPEPAPATATAAPTPIARAPSVNATSPEAAVAGFGQAKVETSAEGMAELFDSVTEVKRVEPTKLQITLASGQVWRQTVGKTFQIRAGDKVRISESGWGNAFRLSVDGRSSFIQVSRVQ